MALVDRSHRVPDHLDRVVEIEVDRLLAQHRDAGVGCAAQVLGMRVGGRRDVHRIDGIRVEHLRDVGGDPGPVLARQGIRPRSVDVIDEREVDIRVAARLAACTDPMVSAPIRAKRCM